MRLTSRGAPAVPAIGERRHRWRPGLAGEGRSATDAPSATARPRAGCPSGGVARRGHTRRSLGGAGARSRIEPGAWSPNRILRLTHAPVEAVLTRTLSRRIVRAPSSASPVRHEVLLGVTDRHPRPERRASRGASAAAAAASVRRAARGRREALRRRRRGRRDRPRRPRRRVLLDARARPGSGKTTTLRMIAGFELPTAGRDPAPRRGRHERAAVRPRRQHGLPGLRAVPAHDRRRQRRLRADGAQGPQGRARDAGGRGAADGPARGLRQRASRASCRAASASAWRSPGRWSTGRACCCSTSRSARSTSSSARRCRSSSRRSSSRSGSRSST